METASVPGWVTHEAEVSASSWESVRVEVTILVSAPGLVASEVTISGTPGRTIRVGTARLFFAPELGTSEGVVSGPLLETAEVVLGSSVPVSAPSLVANEAVISRTSGETSGVGMIVPPVLVLAILPAVVRRVSILEVGVETVVVTVAVKVAFRAVISALSVCSVGGPPGLADDVGATGTGTGPVAPPWAASLGIFVTRSTMPSVPAVNCVDCEGS